MKNALVYLVALVTIQTTTVLLNHLNPLWLVPNTILLACIAATTHRARKEHQ